MHFVHTRSSLRIRTFASLPTWQLCMAMRVVCSVGPNLPHYVHHEWGKAWNYCSVMFFHHSGHSQLEEPPQVPCFPPNVDPKQPPLEDMVVNSGDYCEIDLSTGLKRSLRRTQCMFLQSYFVAYIQVPRLQNG